MYSEGGQARVELCLREQGSGEEFTVTRSFDGTERRVALETSDNKYQGPSAEGHIIDKIWPDAALATDSGEALASVLARGVYLQQDLIRQFVEAATDQERFTAVSELMGAGRVTELQNSLERAKKAWSTATNQREDEVGPLRERLAVITGRLTELEGQAAREIPAMRSEDWAERWGSVTALGVTTGRVDAGSREAPRAIDDAMKQIETMRRSAERRLESLKSLQAEISRLANWATPDVSPLRDRALALRKDVEEQKRLVDAEQSRLAETRRLQAELKEKTEQLKALAALALKQLGDRCPVCGQEYDREATEKLLQEMSRASSGDLALAEAPERLSELLVALESKEKEVGSAEVALASAERAIRERQVAEESLRKRLVDLKVDAADGKRSAAAAAKLVIEAEDLIRKVGELQKVGESLALRLAQSSPRRLWTSFAVKAITCDVKSLVRRRTLLSETALATWRNGSLKRCERQRRELSKNAFGRSVHCSRTFMHESTRILPFALLPSCREL